MKIRVVFFGSKSIGASCLQHIVDSADSLNLEIAALLTNKKGCDLLRIAKKNHIPVLENLDDYLSLPDIDFLISVQFHKILEIEHINKAKKASVNLHMAPLPEYRGCNQFSFSIINEESTFGTTLHLIDEGIDSGPIICERRFAIPSNIWVSDLLKLTEWHSFKMFSDFLPNLITGEFVAIDQSQLKSERGTRLYFRNDVNSLKHIEMSWDLEKICRHIRALSMPGFPGPYFIIEGKKIYLELA